MRRLLTTPFFAILIGVVVVLACANREFFFVSLWHENGDFAVNALQIERAKHFDELYGNYSRFHFNHPGPAFFYVYAAGEWILHDLYSVVPTPHNAHSLFGLALQAAFFAGAVAIAARWFRSPWFIPLALAIGAVHFWLARDAFTSIWPPHVLVMPFLCFLIACASVAAGCTAHLPLAALAGCFLVHGYVAQPLYVVTLFSAAWGLSWWRQRTPGEPVSAYLARFRRPHLLATACVALFIAPLLFDLTYGADSNFSHILEFLRNHRGEQQSWWKSLLYLVSFFCYQHQQENFLGDHGPADTSFLAAGRSYLFAWLLVIAVIGFFAVRLRRDRTNPARPFAYSLLAILGLGIGLSLVWGKIQVGPMFEFNGKFYFATLYAILLAFAGAIATWLPARGATIGGIALCLLAAGIAWATQRPPLSTDDASYSTVISVAAAMRADPVPAATKLLVFDHDDWGEVAGTALALKRAGKSYRVDGNWTFMFGRYRTFRPQPPDYDLGGTFVWRFTRSGPPDQGMPIAKGLRVYFDPLPLDPASAVIDCAKGGNLSLYAIFGFTTPDGPAAWTNMPDAGLQFRSPPVERDVQISITATPFAPDSRNIASQPADLFVNGRKIASIDLHDRETIHARVPRDVWNVRHVVNIVLHIPHAVSPLSLGMSGDPRVLGWSIEKIAFSLAP